MRNIVSALFISLDGVTESPEKWQFDNFDEDMNSEMNEQLSALDAMLLGRVTYQQWASYWPNSTDEPFASFINNIPKYVASRTLDKVEWKNSSLLKGDLGQALADLKAQPGKDIGISGSPTLVRSLVQDDLLDELILMFHPVVAGAGKRLFQDGDALKRLAPAGTKITRSGVIIARYKPRA
jgi:dihydrofolate reductase